MLGIGFSPPHDQSIWLFFTSLTLALLAGFQALIFSLTFYKLVKALVDQRHIDTSGRQDSEAHLVKGTGWIAAGVKIGAIETIIGFAGPGGDGFYAAFIRRLLRTVSRACVIIGVVKG